MRGGDSGTTHRDNMVCRQISHTPCEIPAEILGACKVPIWCQVAREWMIDRTGHVSHNPVDGLDLTCVALWRPRIENAPGIVAHARCELLRNDQPLVVQARDEVGATRGRNI